MSVYAFYVQTLIARIALMLAILLMPLGMAPSAASEAHQAMAAGAPMEHCPDQAPRHDPKGALAQCTMACAAAAPASTASAQEPHLIASAIAMPGLTQRLRGLHPDTATPPPRLA
ncbi:MAG TPA: hypothetical protein VNS11_09775 [Sphingomicrobium sp.]|nr:hypothetical protein [Sphingomicrobium sp.]